MNAFIHTVEIEEATRKLTINRLYEDGSRELFTEITLPTDGAAANPSSYAEFTMQLGENILLDSPIARRLLSL
jgi:hypothetical protein